MSQWNFRKLEVRGHMDSISASTCTNTYGESFDVADLETIAEEIVGTVINRNHCWGKGDATLYLSERGGAFYKGHSGGEEDDSGAEGRGGGVEEGKAVNLHK